MTAPSWAAVALESTSGGRLVDLVTCVVEHVEVGEDDEPLVHRRGRYVAARAGR